MNSKPIRTLLVALIVSFMASSAGLYWANYLNPRDVVIVICTPTDSETVCQPPVTWDGEQ